ncbi:unnamed protein product [Tilletia controversa]|uniref:Lysozyme n=3 Tax=Tilletia TaxID=13289 RepID=A0A8X7MU69_9BASI|nr:hypothetical protein CF336_g4507 [Tilletia laevis]KAE8192703.1 hypothetical protein CF328_g5277 [Tilletia controversa]KAE8260574.1 hypothetical protein A4X03_0g3783 [Tilletia caries]KAE8201696.1 hypothetical protein CF335_g3684 [Tilletia laevis]KAE8249110.1 hypothetical protein A4X06_0g3383 [Tilletia controversa]
MQLRFASVILAITSVSLTGAVQSCINTRGLVGECISTSSCSGNGGSSDAANLCPGDDTIQCCTWSNCNGVAGACGPTLGCAGNPNPANLCPGGDEVQCCQSSPGLLSGWNALQTAHAYQIAKAVRAKGLPRQACLAAICTGITEANLLNYANSDVAESFNYQYDAVSSDYDSVGVFQQRVTYYPNVAADMDPQSAAAQFLDKMVNINGWETTDVGSLCQAVQGSAYPDRYNEHVGQAQDICSAMGF